MRVEILSGPVAVVPGAECEVELEVFNTGDVIDTVTAQVVGDFPLTLAQRPTAVSLFPGTSQRVVVSLTLARDYPAGAHVVPIEMRSAVAPDEDSAELDFEFAVSPVVDGSMDVVPSEITCARTAKFKTQLVNKSNIPVDLALTGTDAERGLSFLFDPPFIHLEPGEEGYVVGRATGKRPFFGVSYARPFTVNADGSGLALTAAGRTNHRPRIPRGVLTIIALAAIIGLWAVIFVLGANFVLNRDKLTKTVPAAFLVGQQNFSTDAVAGTMSGTVTATSDGKPVSRITVEAYLVRTGRQQLEQSAASGADGVWTLASLPPGNYHLRFTAPGFQELWYPSAPDASQAGTVVVRPLAETPKLDVKLAGNLGIISGNVAAGEQTSIIATITVRPMKDQVVGDVVATTTSQPDGSFAVAGLETPATYQLTVALPGFTDQVVTTTLGGGEDQVINSVQMAAGDGVLGGTVSSNGKPLGGVVVTINGAGKTFTATTPTSGPVGAWTLAGLPTPATYVVTFALQGYGTETMALDLAAGQNRNDVNVVMTSGTGTISGVVKDAAGGGLGDVTVTVTGSATPVVTKTLTTGNVGGYTLNALTTPGRYTVTFALDGYSPVTRLVVLDDSGLATGIDVVLSKATGGIAGTVSSGTTKLAGAAITLTDGKTQKATTSADSPAGGYRFDGLAPGSYTMTVQLTGYKTRTLIVTVTAGQDAAADVSLVAS